MAEPRHILTTRPIDEASRELFLHKGYLLDTVSFIRTDTIRDDATFDRIKALSMIPITAIFTSVNAVQAVAECLGARPVEWSFYAIGHATVDKLQHLMPGPAPKGKASDASRLAERIVNDAPTPPLVFFCGDQRREELPEMLARAGHALEELVVYRTTFVHEHLEPVHDAIMFFSPSAVKGFFSVNRPKAGALMCAIGETTAAEIRGHCDHEVIVSPQPTSRDLAAALIAHFEEPEHTK